MFFFLFIAEMNEQNKKKIRQTKEESYHIIRRLYWRFNKTFSMGTRTERKRKDIFQRFDGVGHVLPSTNCRHHFHGVPIAQTAFTLCSLSKKRKRACVFSTDKMSSHCQSTISTLNTYFMCISTRKKNTQQLEWKWVKDNYCRMTWHQKYGVERDGEACNLTERRKEFDYEKACSRKFQIFFCYFHGIFFFSSRDIFFHLVFLFSEECSSKGGI